MSRLLVVLLAVLTTRTGLAETRADRQRTKRLIAAGAAGLVYASTETVFKDALAPDACRWCGVNGFDNSMRDALVWTDTDRARAASNLTGYVASPLVGAGLLLLATSGVDDGRWAQLTDDLIPMFETVAYGQLVVQIVKYSAGRQRPFVHFATAPRELDQDDNLSFFSGHSALTFSIAVSTGVVASRRGYTLAPVVWGAGLALATTTAYLRIAADRHYMTDVLTGTAYGIATGLAIPWLSGSLPPCAAVVPTGNGVSIAGRF